MNKLVVVNNKQCRIDLVDNPEMISKVRKLLSYRQEGAEYSIAFKQGWNGIVSLISSKNTFPAGLKNRVEKLFQDNNIKYEIEDKRKLLPINGELDISDNLQKINFVPRDYQLKVVEATLNNSSGLIRVVTSGGKTAIAGLITARHNTTTIIYVIGLQLMSQFHQTLSSMLGCEIGMIGNGICDIKPITVASVWSVGKAIGLKEKLFDDDDMDEKELFKIEHKEKIIDFLKQAKLHIIDECHISACATLKSIFKQIDGRIYGMSGTPFKNNGEGEDLVIEGIFGHKIIDISAAELIERGLIVAPTIKFVNVPVVSIFGRTYPEVYTQGIVENDLRNLLILKETQNLVSKGCQTLVLFKQIKHGKILFELFKKNGINCELMSGANSLDEREEIKQRLLRRELDVVIGSTIYDIGIDINSLDGCVLCSGGKSKIRSLQRIGRLVRARPGKDKAYIVDFIDNVRYLKAHSKIRAETYMGEKGFKVYLPKQNYGK